MLSVTRELIDGIRAAPPGALSADVLARARVGVVARDGGLEDANALLDVFLEDPTDYQRACALDAVMRTGDRDTARRLAAACLAGETLKEGVQEAVLHALGFLGYAEVRDVLWRCARDTLDYYRQKSAALGLLNLPCDGLEAGIEVAIRACAGKSLFPEFLPALASKVGNPELLPFLLDLGRTTASTDCNCGLVYGIALFGAAGRPYFDQLLFDSRWEAFQSATGTGWWACHGFRHLGGSLAALARQLREWYPTLPFKEWEYRVRVWLQLAECWLADPLPPFRADVYVREPAADVYRAAFDWSSADADDSLTGLLRGDSLRDDGWVPQCMVSALRDRLEDRIAAEVREVARPRL